MAFSDRTKYRVGDRVRDRHNGEEGRVIDLSFLADGALLLTVAFFTHGLLTRKVQEKVLAGQLGGLRFDTLVSRLTNAAASQRVENLDPSHGRVSARAKAAAARDLAPEGRQLTAMERAEIRALEARIGKNFETLGGSHGEPRPGSLADLKRELREGVGKLSDHTYSEHVPELQALKARIAAVEAAIGAPAIQEELTRDTFRLQQLDPVFVPSTKRAPLLRSLTIQGGADPITRGRWAKEVGGVLDRQGSLSPLERQVDRVFSQTHRIRARIAATYEEERRIGGMLDYLRSAAPDAQGNFEGRYVYDLVFNRKRVTMAALEREQALEEFLPTVPLGPLPAADQALLPGGGRTAYDVLKEARRQTARRGRREGVALWKEYGRIISEAVADSPTARRWQSQRRRGSRLLDELSARGQHLATQDAHAAEKLNPILPAGQSSLHGTEVGRTDFQLTVNPERGGFHGQQRGLVAITDLKAELAQARRDALYQRAGVRVGRPTRLRAHVGLDDFFDPARVGRARKQVLLLNGQPVVVGGMNPTTKTISFHARPPALTLHGPGFFNDPQAQLALARDVETGGLQTVGAIEQGATAFGNLVQRRTALGIRGGLTGGAAGVVEVPIPVLQGFMAGRTPASSRQLYEQFFGRDAALSAHLAHQMYQQPFGSYGEAGLSPALRQKLLGRLRALGFHSETEFARAASSYGRQFQHALRTAVPQESMALLRAGAEADDLLGAMNLVAFAHVRSLGDGLSLGQIEGELRGQVARKIAGVAGRRSNSLTAVAASQLSPPAKLAQALMEDGVSLSPEEVLSALGARGVTHEATRSAFSVPGATTVQELKLQLRQYHREVTRRGAGMSANRLSGVRGEVYEEIFGEVGGRDVVERLARRDELASQAFFVAKNLPARGKIDRHLIAAMRDFADASGLHLMGGSPELNSAFHAWRKRYQNPAYGPNHPLTADAWAEYDHLKQQLAFQRAQERYLRKYERAALHTNQAPLTQRLLDQQHQPQIEAAQAAWQRKYAEALAGPDGAALAHHLTVNPNRHIATGPYGHAMGEAEARQLSIAIDAANGGDLSLLRRMGADIHIGRAGKIGVRLYPGAGRTGEPFIYHGMGEGGIARSLTNPDLQVPFGLPERFDLNAASVQELLESGRLRPLTSRSAVARAEKELAQRQSKAVLEALATRADAAPLPVFKAADGTFLGAAERAGITNESILQRTMELLQSDDPFLVLDIETNPATQRILNVSAHRYQVVDGELRALGTELDIATPRYFAGSERGTRAERVAAQRRLSRGAGTAADRTMVKRGTAHTVSEVVGSEKQLLARVGEYLEAHPHEIVAGHNIGFDAGSLRDRMPGLPALEGRLADTMVAYQAGHPGLPSYTQEALAARFLGETRSQPHIAAPDQRQAARLVAAAPRDEATLARLASARRQILAVGETLWDTEQRNAYRVAGIIDPQLSREAEFGLILHPIDFRTGQVVSSVPKIERGGPAHGFATHFYGKYERLEEASYDPTLRSRARAYAQRQTEGKLQGLMDETVEDLARKRLRRIMDPNGGFTELLKERERLALARSGNLGEAVEDLAARAAAATSPGAQETLRKTIHWSRWLEAGHDPRGGPGRIAAQLEAEAAFLEAEVAGPHSAVVRWLEAHVNNAGPAGLVSAQEQANAVWGHYLERSQTLTAFETVTDLAVPLRRQGLSVAVPLLGENPIRVRTGTPENAARDLERLTHRAAAALSNEEVQRVTAGLPAEEVADLTRRLAQTRASLAEGRIAAPILDSGAGRAIRQHVWEAHLQPAFAAGFTQRDAAGNPVRMAVSTPQEALVEVQRLGQEHAARSVQSLANPLAPRSFDPPALSRLQQQVMAPGTVSQAAEALGQAQTLYASARHGAPHEWIGQDMALIIGQGQGLQGEALAGFQSTLSGMRAQMAAAEKRLLDDLLIRHGMKWWEVAGQGANVFTGQVEAIADLTLSRVSRAFRPGAMNSAGLELAELITAGGGSFKKLGTAGLALGAGLLAMGALRAPRDPAAPAGAGGADAGTRSGPESVQRRVDRLQQHQTIASRIRVVITGEDPVGIDHRELTASVHEALGQFMGQDIGHEPRVRDQRQQIDREFLNRVGARLLKHGTRPGGF